MNTQRAELPWSVTTTAHMHHEGDNVIEKLITLASSNNETIGYISNFADADYIAQACNLYPMLVASLEHLLVASEAARYLNATPEDRANLSEAQERTRDLLEECGEK